MYYASVNSSCVHLTGYCGTFARLFCSTGSELANFTWPWVQVFANTGTTSEPLARTWLIRARALLLVFEKFTRAYLFQIAREKSCDYALIIYTKNITTTTNFDSAHVFSSFNWLAETYYYLCQIQTFFRTTLSKSFS